MRRSLKERERHHKGEEGRGDDDGDEGRRMKTGEGGCRLLFSSNNNSIKGKCMWN